MKHITALAHKQSLTPTNSTAARHAEKPPLLRPAPPPIEPPQRELTADTPKRVGINHAALARRILRDLTGLPSNGKIILLALLDRADSAGECYPAMQTIAAAADTSTRTAQRVVDWLHANDYIAIIKRTSANRRQTTNIYRLTPARWQLETPTDGLAPEL